MSVLEGWRVKYLKSGEEKSESFNWYEFERLKKFMVEYEVTSVIFNATGLPESSERRVNSKNVYEKAVPKEEVVNLSLEWVEERRKEY